MTRLKEARHTLGELDARSVTRLVGAVSDLALVLDDEGTIIEVVTQRQELGTRGNREWLGRPWVQIVTTESRQKVEALLRDAQAAVDVRRLQSMRAFAGVRSTTRSRTATTCPSCTRRCAWRPMPGGAPGAASWRSVAT